MKVIFSFEGGGIKGIRSQVIAVEIEKALQDKTGNVNARLSDYVDMFAGTSTGAIQTAMHIAPKNGLAYSAREVLDFYFNKSQYIFSKKKPLSLLFSPKYSGIPFLNTAKEVFGGMRIGDLLKYCFITAYDLAEPKEYFFTNWEDNFENSYVTDAVLSSCFAPTYFSPYVFTDSKGTKRAMWDGGVFMGNPALGALTEALRVWNIDRLSDIIIVSFGTGHKMEPLNYGKLALAGAVGTVVPLLDVMLSASGRTVNYHLNKFFEGSGNFYALDPLPVEGSSEMDDASNKNMQALYNDGVLWCEHNRGTINEITNALIKNNNEKIKA